MLYGLYHHVYANSPQKSRLMDEHVSSRQGFGELMALAENDGISPSQYHQSVRRRRFQFRVFGSG